MSLSPPTAYAKLSFVTLQAHQAALNDYDAISLVKVSAILRNHIFNKPFTPFSGEFPDNDPEKPCPELFSFMKMVMPE